MKKSLKCDLKKIEIVAFVFWQTYFKLGMEKVLPTLTQAADI